MVQCVNGSGAKIPQGRKLVNKGLPVSKLTIASAGAAGFAVIFSMSHTIANGGTYYQILNMISADGTITPRVSMAFGRRCQSTWASSITRTSLAARQPWSTG